MLLSSSSRAAIAAALAICVVCAVGFDAHRTGRDSQRVATLARLMQERAKLFATFVNTVAAAAIITGILQPLVAARSVAAVHSLLYLLAGITLHLVAQSVLHLFWKDD